MARGLILEEPAGQWRDAPVEEGLELSLRGRIDRVDFAEEDGSLYVKVIDYKSGSTKLDLGKVYYWTAAAASALFRGSNGYGSKKKS